MLLSAFPDLLSFNRQTRTTNEIKSRMETTAIEAVTGLREDATAAVNGDIGGALLVKKAIDDIEQDGRINSLSAARLSLTSSVLSSVRGVVGGISTDAIAGLTTGDSFTLDTIAATAQSNLRSVMSSLGTAHGNRKLFAGDATDTFPLASTDVLLDDIRGIFTANPDPVDAQTALDTYFNDPTGGFATNIYQGGDGDAPSAFLSDGTKVEFTVRADNQALRDTMRGLAVIALAQENHDITSTEYSDLMKQGAASVGKGTGNIIKLEGELGISENLIEKIGTQQSDERISLSLSYNAMLGRDQYEAAAELKQLESQLEASYLITARLSNLTLTNFLR